MIQIEKIHIEEFRGIRSIDLLLGGESFVIYGPNGSGKSGVVDAIDFALTGDIARLQGAGTAGVSLLHHGPHVHRRDDPGAAKVGLTVRDIATGESALLVRSVKSAQTYSLTPDSPAMRTALAGAMSHPELTLSRRELIKFIVARPGDRASEVQALLKLERVEAARRALKSASTKASAEAKGTNSEKITAEQAFAQLLGLTNLLSTEVLKQINARRAVLGLADLDTLTADTDLLDGLSERTKEQSFNLTSAKAAINALIDSSTSETTSIMSARAALESSLGMVISDTELLDAIKHRTLVEMGLASLSGANCPLCEMSWESQETLRAHLEARIARTEVAEQMRSAVLTAGAAYSVPLRKLRASIETVIPITDRCGATELSFRLGSWRDALKAVEGELTDFDRISTAAQSVLAPVETQSDDIRTGLAALLSDVSAIPDETREEDARTFLALANDRWTRVRLARSKSSQSEAVRTAAAAVYEAYAAAADSALADLYATVEQDFSSYYQFLNSDDESRFRAELTPSSGSLDLRVDFFTLGMFPPVAYHSEGHQDGMGICLYLALVKQLLGDQFRFAVLDDVVMSVDSNHRRRFAELLQQEFPDVQFVITTHDEMWARQLKASGLIKSRTMARFSSWSVDSGPTVDSGDSFDSIEHALAGGDVAGAAHKLRKLLEASCADIAERIGGSVVYNAEGNYDLSDFLDAIKGRHSKILALAASSAEAWNSASQRELVLQLKQRRATVLSEHDAEHWLVNKLVHNNDWAAGTEADFRPVLESARDFLSLFKCENPDCASWIKVTGRTGREESLRCACGSYNLNLLKK